MITHDEMKKKIDESGVKGVWTGYIRAKCENGDELIDELLESDNYSRVKNLGSIGTNGRQFKWAIIRSN